MLYPAPSGRRFRGSPGQLKRLLFVDDEPRGYCKGSKPACTRGAKIGTCTLREGGCQGDRINAGVPLRRAGNGSSDARRGWHYARRPGPRRVSRHHSGRPVGLRGRTPVAGSRVPRAPLLEQTLRAEAARGMHRSMSRDPSADRNRRNCGSRLGAVGALPPMPSTFAALQRALADPSIDLSKVSAIIEKDPGGLGKSTASMQFGFLPSATPCVDHQAGGQLFGSVNGAQHGAVR